MNLFQRIRQRIQVIKTLTQEPNIWSHLNLLQEDITEMESNIRQESITPILFPIRIYVHDTDQCLLCRTPEDIPSGQAFVILKCNVGG